MKDVGSRCIGTSAVRVLIAVLSLFLGGTALLAQNRQEFTGRVADSSGAIVPGAAVVVHNEQTGVDYKSTTTSSGDYTVPYVIPGVYDVTVTKGGFKVVTKTGITLNVDQVSRIDFTLQVGGTTETVTVNASGTQVELTKADRGEVIDGERIAEMPLDGRNPYSLVELSPGVHDFSQAIYPRPFDLDTHNEYVNGSPQTSSLNIDGVSNDAGGTSGAAGLVPSVDVLGEFKIVLNAYDASYGHAGGSAVDMSLKSGTNGFHGTLDYYMRRPWLDTLDWQTKYLAAANGTTPRKVAHKRDQYSMEFDGPVVIPHVFNGKDKLYYVLSYEWMNDILPSNSYSTYSIPNPAWLTGDFSGAQFEYTYPGNGANPCGAGVNQCLQPLTIYDPLTPLRSVVDPRDGKTKLSRSAFPGNKIPLNRIDPVGAAVLATYSYVKPNNNPGSGFAPYTNNYVNLQVENDIWRNALVKVDYNVRDSDKLSFRWGGQGRWNNVNSNTGYPIADPANIQGNQIQPQSETGSVTWTHTFSPRLLFNLGISLITEDENGAKYGSVFSNEPAALGFAQSYYSQLFNNQKFPYITVSAIPNAQQYGPFSGSQMGTSSVLHMLQFIPTVTYVHGVHTLRAGVDMRFQQFANPFGGNNDTFAFTNNFTNQFYNSPEAPNFTSGDSIASLLLGYPNTGTAYNNLHTLYSQHYYAPWLQDDWKLSPRLTLNLGVRWDLLTPRTERFNKMTGAFNPTVLNPVTALIPTGTAAFGSNTRLQGGLLFAAVNGQPRAAYAMNMLNVQPRVGFTYAITSRMSVRGGIGQNYLNDTATNGTSGFASSTGYTNSVDNGVTPYTACATGTVAAGTCSGAGFANPISKVLQPTGASLGYYQSLGNNLSFFNPNYHIPALWSYSMTYEVAPTKWDVLSIAYVGNRVPNNPVSDDLNHIAPQWNAQCDVERGGNRHLCDDTSTGQIANPYLGIAPFAGTSYYTSSTISKSNFTRPYPEFGTVTENGVTSNGKTWYNSLQMTASHQMSRSLSLHAAYTHAKAETSGGWLDTVNRVWARQVSTTNDVKHAVTVSGVAYLPFGRNRLFFSNSPRWLDAAINGWEISPLYTWYSGFPWRPSGTWEMASTGLPVQSTMGVSQTILPRDGAHNYNRIRGATPCVGTKDTDTGVVIPSAAAAQAGCSALFVTTPNSYAIARNNIDFGVRQPGATRFDVAASKNFRLPDASKLFLSERANLQIRVDLLNALNHANWDEGYSSSNGGLEFGTIAKGPTGPTNPPRYLQLSARFNW